MNELFTELYKTLFNSELEKINKDSDEPIDVYTKEGLNKINEIIDKAEKDPYTSMLLTIFGYDLNEVREAFNAFYENFGKDKECNCCKDKECNSRKDKECDCCKECCDECCEECCENSKCECSNDYLCDIEDDEDFEHTDCPLRYCSQISDKHYNTIHKLVDEFMGEMEVEYETKLSNKDYHKLEKILENFAAFILVN